MTKTTARPEVADTGHDRRDPVRREGIPSGIRSRLRDGLEGIMSRVSSKVSTKARWIISAAVGLVTPAVLIAEGAATPLAQAIACIGNGSFMALAASANAFTLIP